MASWRHSLLASHILPKHFFAGGHSGTTRADAGTSLAGFNGRFLFRTSGDPTTTNPSGGRGQHLWESLCSLPRTRWAREWSSVQSFETRGSRPDETFAAKSRHLSCHSCANCHLVWCRRPPTRTWLEGDANLGADFPRDRV